MKKRRGEAVTIAVAAVAGICLLVGILFRPIVDKVLPMFGNNQKITSTKVVESKPIWIKNPDGSSTMVQTTSTTIDNSAQKVKLTLWQKIRNLGSLGILLVILGIIFPPFGVVLALVWKRFSSAAKAALEGANSQIEEWRTQREELSVQAKRIVASVDEGLASMDANIRAANTMANSTVDAVVKASYTTIAKALTDMKQDFLNAMSKKQDSITKLLVSELKND